MLFSLSHQPPVVVHVCDDLACLHGAEKICAELKDPRSCWRSKPRARHLASQPMSRPVRTRPQPSTAGAGDQAVRCWRPATVSRYAHMNGNATSHAASLRFPRLVTPSCVCSGGRCGRSHESGCLPRPRWLCCLAKAIELGPEGLSARSTTPSCSVVAGLRFPGSKVGSGGPGCCASTLSGLQCR